MSEQQEPVIIRDNRKIDPVTGEARQVAREVEDSTSTAGPADPASPDGSVGAADPAGPAWDEPVVDDASLLLAERTADLQRVQAEYANYRKRADRERLAAGEVAVGVVLATMLPVLDNLDRAREHGDLTAGLKAVADQLDDIFAKLGLTSFGAAGDPFDPVIHEAVMHNESADVSEPTVTVVMRPGYQHGERMLRPAMVGVSDPAAPAEPAEPEAG